jgi:hypothetical protein
MLSPSKHLDLDRSILRVSGEVLRLLRRRRLVQHDALVRFIKEKTADDGDVVVAPALNFLYLLGLLEYHVKTDSFEYIEPRRA